MRSFGCHVTGEDGAGLGNEGGRGGGHAALPVQGSPPTQVHNGTQVGLTVRGYLKGP